MIRNKCLIHGDSVHKLAKFPEIKGLILTHEITALGICPPTNNWSITCIRLKCFNATHDTFSFNWIWMKLLKSVTMSPFYSPLMNSIC